MIVLRRVDVNKKPMRLIEIPDLCKLNPPRLDLFQQIHWPPAARFDQFGSVLPAGVDTIEGGERLGPAVLLNRDYRIMVHAKSRKVTEELSSHKRKVAGDDDGPVALARCKRSMQTAQRAPLRINIRNARETGIVAANDCN